MRRKLLREGQNRGLVGARHQAEFDIAGKTHDIVVLGHNVSQVAAQMDAYGLPSAVQC